MEALGRAGGGPGGVLGGSGAALEPFKRCLGSSPGRLGAVLRALDVRLEPSGSQKGSKMEPKRVLNRAIAGTPGGSFPGNNGRPRMHQLRPPKNESGGVLEIKSDEYARSRSQYVFLVEFP